MIEKLKTTKHLSQEELNDIVEYCIEVLGTSDFLHTLLDQMEREDLEKYLRSVVTAESITDDEF